MTMQMVEHLSLSAKITMSYWNWQLLQLTCARLQIFFKYFWGKLTEGHNGWGTLFPCTWLKCCACYPECWSSYSDILSLAHTCALYARGSSWGKRTGRVNLLSPNLRWACFRVRHSCNFFMVEPRSEQNWYTKVGQSRFLAINSSLIGGVVTETALVPAWLIKLKDLGGACRVWTY